MPMLPMLMQMLRPHRPTPTAPDTTPAPRLVTRPQQQSLPLYEWCLLKELGLRGLECVSQKSVVIQYKGFTREEPLRFDVLVESSVLVEAKAVEKVLPIHKAQLLSYMKLLNVPVGLLINFHEMKVTNGIHRLILSSANR